MPESHAFLTLDEVLAVRLYSGPSYQPLNNFLRQVAAVSGRYREEMAQHPSLTFTATVRHLCCAIRKLAAHTPPDEARSPLYRGVRGELGQGFWHSTDSMGMRCAVDMAFMSTSKNKNTPISYMKPGKNVLWRMYPSAETETAFHRGADMSFVIHEFGTLATTMAPSASALASTSASIAVASDELASALLTPLHSCESLRLSRLRKRLVSSLHLSASAPA